MGAAVGEVLVGRKVGNKGALWGAVCGTIPDLDFLFGAFMNDLDKNIFHRSVSHSLLFFVLAAPVTGYLIHKIHNTLAVGWKAWSWVAFWAYLTHALLDCFTTWGTQLFWPITTKVAFKSVFVVDPTYTIPFIVCLVLALRLHQDHRKRKIWVWAGIGISSAYLMFTLIAKYSAEHYFDHLIKSKKISYLRMETKPAPFNAILWAATIETNDGYYMGYHSFFDAGDAPLQYVPKNEELLSVFTDDKTKQKLMELTEGWYTVEQNGDVLYLNDLRFGTLSGWKEGGDFVFSYEIKLEDGKWLVKERKKRLKQPPSRVFGDLWNRVWGSY